MLEVYNLQVGYGDRMVLNGVSMQAHCGEITTVLGRNGCGKTTLLKALIGLLPINTGDILIDECPVAKMTKKNLAKQIAYLPQSKNIPDISAGNLVLHGRFPYLAYPRRYSEADRKIAQNALQKMQIADLWDTPLAELSGGMRQKVYIAMALAKQSPIILMDEPTTYLDIGQQRLFSQTVRDLANQGKCVVLVLHDLLLALKLSDRICVVEDGIILEQGTPDDILCSGVLQRLYEIEIGTIETGNGIQYYYK